MNVMNWRRLMSDMGGFLPLPVGSRMLSLHLDDSALPLHITCDEPSLRHSCLTAIGCALVITLSRTTKRQQSAQQRDNKESILGRLRCSSGDAPALRAE